MTSVYWESRKGVFVKLSVKDAYIKLFRRVEKDICTVGENSSPLWLFLLFVITYSISSLCRVDMYVDVDVDLCRYVE